MSLSVLKLKDMSAEKGSRLATNKNKKQNKAS